MLCGIEAGVVAADAALAAGLVDEQEFARLLSPESRSEMSTVIS